MAEQETFAFAAKKAEPGASAARGSEPQAGEDAPAAQAAEGGRRRRRPQAAEPSAAEGDDAARRRAEEAAQQGRHARHRARAREAAARHLGLRVLRQEPPPARLRQPARRRCSPTVKEARRQLARRLRGGGHPARRPRRDPPARRDRFRVAIEDNGPGIVHEQIAEDLRQAALRLEVPPPAPEPRPAGHRHQRGRHVRPAHHRQARSRITHAHRAKKPRAPLRARDRHQDERAEGEARRGGRVGAATTARASRSSSRRAYQQRPALGRRLPRADGAREPARAASSTCRRRPTSTARATSSRASTKELPPETARDQAAPVRRRARRADADAARHRRRAT